MMRFSGTALASLILGAVFPASITNVAAPKSMQEKLASYKESLSEMTVKTTFSYLMRTLSLVLFLGLSPVLCEAQINYQGPYTYGIGERQEFDKVSDSYPFVFYDSYPFAFYENPTNNSFDIVRFSHDTIEVSEIQYSTDDCAGEIQSMSTVKTISMPDSIVPFKFFQATQTSAKVGTIAKSSSAAHYGIIYDKSTRALDSTFTLDLTVHVLNGFKLQSDNSMLCYGHGAPDTSGSPAVIEKIEADGTSSWWRASSFSYPTSYFTDVVDIGNGKAIFCGITAKPEGALLAYSNIDHSNKKVILALADLNNRQIVLQDEITGEMGILFSPQIAHLGGNENILVYDQDIDPTVADPSARGVDSQLAVSGTAESLLSAPITKTPRTDVRSYMADFLVNGNAIVATGPISGKEDIKLNIINGSGTTVNSEVISTGRLGLESMRLHKVDGLVYLSFNESADMGDWKKQIYLLCL